MKDPDGYMIPCEHFPLRPLSRFSLFRISQITLSACFWFLNKVGCNWTPPRHRTLVTSFTDSCRGLPAAISQGWSFRGTLNLIHKRRGCVIKIRQGKGSNQEHSGCQPSKFIIFHAPLQVCKNIHPCQQQQPAPGNCSLLWKLEPIHQLVKIRYKALLVIKLSFYGGNLHGKNTQKCTKNVYNIRSRYNVSTPFIFY